jgi:anionic cell wall polymer biosynthesis LytR-Cps2A-Psr (LCP) family protein
VFEIGGQQFAKGRIELDGERALLYSRYRGGDDGDFGRVSKQQQVLRALLDEAASLDLVRMIPRMFGLLSDHFRSDLGATELLDLANTYRDSCNSTSLETQTIPGDVDIMHDDMMQMELSFVVSKPEDVRKEVEWLIGGD